MIDWLIEWLIDWLIDLNEKTQMTLCESLLFLFRKLLDTEMSLMPFNLEETYSFIFTRLRSGSISQAYKALVWLQVLCNYKIIIPIRMLFEHFQVATDTLILDNSLRPRKRPGEPGFTQSRAPSAAGLNGDGPDAESPENETTLPCFVVMLDILCHQVRKTFLTLKFKIFISLFDETSHFLDCLGHGIVQRLLARLIVWLISLLGHESIDWLIDGVISRLIAHLINWLVDWLFSRSMIHSIDWLIDLVSLFVLIVSVFVVGRCAEFSGAGMGISAREIVNPLDTHAGVAVARQAGRQRLPIGSAETADGGGRYLLPGIVVQTHA